MSRERKGAEASPGFHFVGLNLTHPHLTSSEIVPLGFLSLCGTMHDNFGGINPFIPPWVRPWKGERETEEELK